MNQKILIGIIAAIVLVAGTVVVLHHHKGASASKDSEETNVPVNQLLAQAAKYEAQGDKLKAKEAYDQIISNYPDYDKIEEVQEQAWEFKHRSYFFSRSNAPNYSL